MSVYEQIQELSIKDIDSDRLKRWITDEIYTLADDFGQKLDQDQAKHIGNRLLGLFTSTKVRSWSPGTVHAIFQSGLTGAYGKASKVTYFVLINWIWSYDRSQRSENKYTGNINIEYDKPDSYYRQQSEEWVPFIKWCEDRNIAAHHYTSEQLIALKNRFNNIGPNMMDLESERLEKYKPAGNLTLI